MSKVLKVVIADDEALAREGLRDNIPWSEYGFEVVGCAKNGVEALEMVDANSPQILITDIMMPEMDGLALLDEVSKRKLDILVMIISAYNEFTYAQKALKYDIIYDYVLKPLNLREFKETLIKLPTAWNEKYSMKKKLEIINTDFAHVTAEENQPRRP